MLATYGILVLGKLIPQRQVQLLCVSLTVLACESTTKRFTVHIRGKRMTNVLPAFCLMSNYNCGSVCCCWLCFIFILLLLFLFVFSSHDRIQSSAGVAEPASIVACSVHFQPWWSTMCKRESVKRSLGSKTLTPRTLSICRKIPLRLSLKIQRRELWLLSLTSSVTSLQLSSQL